MEKHRRLEAYKLSSCIVVKNGPKMSHFHSSRPKRETSSISKQSSKRKFLNMIFLGGFLTPVVLPIWCFVKSAVMVSTPIYC